ncbi:MAG: YebC/PmpR family DNA-binding transcriptional regulator, partial [Planctomycetota bacterium]
SELSRIPDSTIAVADAETARKILNLVEDFEDHDDVQEVFGNFEIPDDILSQLQ